MVAVVEKGQGEEAMGEVELSDSSSMPALEHDSGPTEETEKTEEDSDSTGTNEEEEVPNKMWADTDSEDDNVGAGNTNSTEEAEYVGAGNTNSTEEAETINSQAKQAVKLMVSLQSKVEELGFAREFAAWIAAQTVAGGEGFRACNIDYELDDDQVALPKVVDTFLAVAAAEKHEQKQASLPKKGKEGQEQE